MPRMLGRLPHDPRRPVLRLADYLTGEIPDHPDTADYLARVTDWGLYANDRFGVCGPAAVANQRKQVSLYLDAAEQSPSLDDVFALYRTQCPGFDPTTGAGDNGVVLADLLSALLRDGIGGVKPLAYAAVDVGNPDEVRAAVALFGSLLFGVSLETGQQEQTDAGGPWDLIRRGPGTRPWGGHAVLAGAYTSVTGRGQPDISVVSWGEVLGTTDAFCGRQLDEAWVVIWPEHLGTTEFADGVNLAALAADYEQLTGRPFPSLPRPTPEPEPEPEPVPGPGPPDFPAELADFIVSAQLWLASRGRG